MGRRTEPNTHTNMLCITSFCGFSICSGMLISHTHTRVLLVHLRSRRSLVILCAHKTTGHLCVCSSLIFSQPIGALSLRSAEYFWWKQLPHRSERTNKGASARLFLYSSTEKTIAASRPPTKRGTGTSRCRKHEPTAGLQDSTHPAPHGRALAADSRSSEPQRQQTEEANVSDKQGRRRRLPSPF